MYVVVCVCYFQGLSICSEVESQVRITAMGWGILKDWENNYWYTYCTKRALLYNTYTIVQNNLRTLLYVIIYVKYCTYEQPILLNTFINIVLLYKVKNATLLLSIARSTLLLSIARSTLLLSIARSTLLYYP